MQITGVEVAAIVVVIPIVTMFVVVVASGRLQNLKIRVYNHLYTIGQ